MTQEAIEAYISGKVQGVWFRDFTQTTAMAMGLTGYVENLPDGRVHLVAAGPEERIKAFLEAMRQGPPAADVTGIDTARYAGDEVFADFSVRR